MYIAHVGHSVLHTPHSSIHLNNILHVPSGSESLLSAHKIALDNNAFVEFHLFLFLINYHDMKHVMFRGPCHGGLYPLIHVSTGLPSMHSPPSSLHHPHDIIIYRNHRFASFNKSLGKLIFRILQK
jgi:hypothetical protein